MECSLSIVINGYLKLYKNYVFKMTIWALFLIPLFLGSLFVRWFILYNPQYCLDTFIMYRLYRKYYVMKQLIVSSPVPPVAAADCVVFSPTSGCSWFCRIQCHQWQQLILSSPVPPVGQFTSSREFLPPICSVTEWYKSAGIPCMPYSAVRPLSIISGASRPAITCKRASGKKYWPELQAILVLIGKV